MKSLLFMIKKVLKKDFSNSKHSLKKMKQMSFMIILLFLICFSSSQETLEQAASHARWIMSNSITCIFLYY